MSIYDNDDLFMAAQSCKQMKPKSSITGGSMRYEGISCSMCGNWDGSRCNRRVLDNVLSGPELN